MASSAPSSSLQIVTGDGEFRSAAVSEFAKTNGLASAGTAYHTVAIMGPQSSGKSTLLNNLFGTKFVEMDALSGRSQTTQGIWLEKCPVLDNLMLVMDLEGSDGRERGEDDTAFEKKTALFAMAVADVLLVNLWCHDIGRETGSGKPLLKTVFEVNMKLFDPRRTVLLFVVRDRSKTPFEKLTAVLREDICKIFDAIPRPPRHEKTTLDDFFELKFTSLPNYDAMPEQFVSECEELRAQFVPGSGTSLVGEETGSVPGDAFSLSAGRIWDVISSNKDLDLPAHKVMVATVRCGEICLEHLLELVEGTDWREIVESAENGPVAKFGSQASAMINECLSKYDEETAYFDGTVRASKRGELQEKALRALQPAHAAQIAHAREAAVAAFTRAVQAADDASFASAAQEARAAADASYAAAVADADVEGSGWDPAKPRAQLEQALGEVAARVEEDRLRALTAKAESTMGELLGGGVAALLEEGGDIWPPLRSLVAQTCEEAGEQLAASAAGLGLAAARIDALGKQVAEAGQARAAERVREAAATAAARLRGRFQRAFESDASGVPRVWGGGDDIPKAAEVARASAARLLAQLAVLRLDGGDEEQAGSSSSSSSAEGKAVGAATEAILALAAPAAPGGGGHGDAAAEGSAAAPGLGLLGRSAWAGIPVERVVLSPQQVSAVWREFVTDSGHHVSKALAAQEAAKRGGNGMPPAWAIVLIAVLGMDELLWVLRNPFLLVLLGLLAMFGKAIFQQLEVESSMRLGVVPGILAIASRVVPAVLGVVSKLAEAAAAPQPLAAEGSSAVAAGARAVQDEGPPEETASSAAGGGGGTPSQKKKKAAAVVGVSEEGLRQRGNLNEAESPVRT